MELDVAHIHEAIAAAVPTRECIVWRDRRLTWAAVTDRTRRLANLLLAHGLGAHADPASVNPWESAQDHLALYLTNCNEYLEGMLGAYKARVGPFNVNYRYVADELGYVLRDARARAIVYHARYAPLLADVLPQLDDEPALLGEQPREVGERLEQLPERLRIPRTNPDAPKHRGISFLLMDRHTPGISVRPLVNMAWHHGFNETFFEDVPEVAAPKSD